MAKQGTDGVYDSDPRTNPDAKKFDDLTYDEFLAGDLKVADATAISLARDYQPADGLLRPRCRRATSPGSSQVRRSVPPSTPESARGRTRREETS